MKKLLITMLTVALLSVGGGFAFKKGNVINHNREESSRGESPRDILFVGGKSGVEYRACQRDFIECHVDTDSKRIYFYFLEPLNKDILLSLPTHGDILEVESYYIVYSYKEVELLPCAHCLDCEIK